MVSFGTILYDEGYSEVNDIFPAERIAEQRYENIELIYFNK